MNQSGIWPRQGGFCFSFIRSTCRAWRRSRPRSMTVASVWSPGIFSSRENFRVHATGRPGLGELDEARGILHQQDAVGLDLDEADSSGGACQVTPPCVTCSASEAKVRLANWSGWPMGRSRNAQMGTRGGQKQEATGSRQ